MPWPDRVVRQFGLVDWSTPEESEYYGPFNTLLTTLFPPADNYQVAPQYTRTSGSMAFSVTYVFMKRKVPVFFVEVGTGLALDHASSRKEADDQMRERFLDVAPGNLAVPKLYGLSALGTRFSVYEYQSETRLLAPPHILPDPDIVTDTAPKERWGYDIMELEGETKLKTIVARIQEMTTGLE